MRILKDWQLKQESKYEASKVQFSVRFKISVEEETETRPLRSRWSLIILQDVMLDVLHHGEAIHFLSFDPDDSGQSCVRHNASSIVWILQMMGLGVVPEQPGDLSPGGCLPADDGGQRGVHSDGSLQGHVTWVPSQSQPPSSTNPSVSGPSPPAIPALDQVVFVEEPASPVSSAAPELFWPDNSSGRGLTNGLGHRLDHRLGHRLSHRLDHRLGSVWLLILSGKIHFF
jgi:hypothetical protein